MPAKAPSLYPASNRQLQALGARLRAARLRRTLSAEAVCARADITRPTLSKIEHGDGSVTMGNYVQVLRVLGLEQDLAGVAADDIVGRRLQDAKLPRRERAPRRKAAGQGDRHPMGVPARRTSTVALEHPESPADNESGKSS